MIKLRSLNMQVDGITNLGMNILSDVLVKLMTHQYYSRTKNIIRVYGKVGKEKILCNLKSVWS